MNKTVNEKMPFLLCEMAGVKGKFILQTEGNQYVFQLLFFESERQLKEYREVDKAPYTKVKGYLIGLRLSCALQQVEVGQSNYKDVLAEVAEARRKAGDWYLENFIQKDENAYLAWREAPQ